ncbi:MAG: LysM peptidoglycan-binding domain-containing protein [Anaerolineales bacterium]|jgi:LysM repeat protein
MNDKRFTPSMLAAHRKRQERAARLLLIFWVGVMFIVIGAGYLIYRFLKPGQSPQALIASGTPGLTETYLPSASPSTATLASATTQPPEQTLVPTSAALPTASFITYTVKEGETLIGIANGLGVGLPTLIALNPTITPEFLNVGDQLTIPAQGNNLTATPAPPGSQAIEEYQVKAGDTVAGIAAQFGTTIGAIVRENNLASPDQIQEGQTLRIPVAASTPSPTAPEATTVAPTSQG